jgi:hypothetical protein
LTAIETMRSSERRRELRGSVDGDVSVLPPE